MSDPLTHIVWGYVITRSVTRRPDLLLLGSLTSILPDLDAVLPGFSHHGWLHTPVFILFICLTLWGAGKDPLLFRVPALAISSHFVLDSIGGGIMWFWPISTEARTLLPITSPAGLATAEVFILLLPAYWLWDLWKRTGDSPLSVIRWMEGMIPLPVVRGASSTLGLFLVLSYATRFISTTV